MRREFHEPLRVEAVRADEKLYITWRGGHQSAYQFEYLRWRCPCAVCQGEGDTPGVLSFLRDLQPEQTALDGLQMVGRYAISPRWRDGHASGIYPFEYLRAICPCDHCRYAQPGR